MSTGFFEDFEPGERPRDMPRGRYQERAGKRTARSGSVHGEAQEGRQPEGQRQGLRDHSERCCCANAPATKDVSVNALTAKGSRPGRAAPRERAGAARIDVGGNVGRIDLSRILGGAGVVAALGLLQCEAGDAANTDPVALKKLGAHLATGICKGIDKCGGQDWLPFQKSCEAGIGAFLTYGVQPIVEEGVRRNKIQYFRKVSTHLRQPWSDISEHSRARYG